MSDQEQSTASQSVEFDLQESINQLKAHFHAGPNNGQGGGEKSHNRQDAVKAEDETGQSAMPGGLSSKEELFAEDDLAVAEQYLAQFALDDGEHRRCRRKTKPNHRPRSLRSRSVLNWPKPAN